MRDWQEDRETVTWVLNSQVRSINSIAGRVFDIADHWLNECRHFAERNLKLDRQVTELETQCAAMRGALVAIANVDVIVEEKPYGKIISTPTLESVKRYARERLADSTAGQTLLDRLEKAEAVVKAAEKICSECPLPQDFCAGNEIIGTCINYHVSRTIHAYREVSHG